MGMAYGVSDGFEIIAEFSDDDFALKWIEEMESEGEDTEGWEVVSIEDPAKDAWNDLEKEYRRYRKGI